MEYFCAVKLVDCFDENIKVIIHLYVVANMIQRQACLKKKRKKNIIKNLPIKNSKL